MDKGKKNQVLGLLFRALILLAPVAAFNACDLLELRSDETLLAKAYGSRLYLEDLPDILPAGISHADSLAIISRYVNRWLQQQVVLQHAMEYPLADQKGIERKIADYRNSLIIHAYESEVARLEMDTVVSARELEEYYQQNQEHFKLKDHIVDVTYIKLPLGVSDVGQVRSLYRSDNREELDRLSEFCLQHAATYFISNGTWMPFQDILRDIPLQTTDPAGFLRTNRHLEITDDYYRYFLYVHNYRLRGETAPKAFEEDNIRLLILNRRKNLFIQDKRRDLFDRAIESNRIETYF